jgi:hypothetical protein
MLERRRDCDLGSFSRYHSPPERSPERPGDLNLIREFRHIVRMRCAHPNDRVFSIAVIDEPETEVVLLPVGQVVLEPSACMLRVELRPWTKRMPDVAVCPDDPESVLVTGLKTVKREPAGVDRLPWIAPVKIICGS